MTKFARSLAVGCAGAICALAIVACGSSDKPKSSAASYTTALKFSNCMRAHGVSNFPDPSSGGGLKLQPASGLDPLSPSFQSAQKACSKYAPAGPGAVTMSASDRRKALKFAQCVRAHGDPNFPDPTLSVKSNGPVIALRGMFFPVGQGFDPQSPAFKQAAARCGFRVP